jgi:hypothetical protein
VANEKPKRETRSGREDPAGTENSRGKLKAEAGRNRERKIILGALARGRCHLGRRSLEPKNEAEPFSAHTHATTREKQATRSRDGGSSVGWLTRGTQIPLRRQTKTRIGTEFSYEEACRKTDRKSQHKNARTEQSGDETKSDNFAP